MVFAYPARLRGLDVLPRLLLHRARASASPHPFVGLDNYKTVLTDPAVLAVVRATSAIFLIINVPLTVVLSLVLASRAEPGDPRAARSSGSAYYVPYVTASVAVVGGLAVPVQLRRPGQPDPRAAGARPVLAGQLAPGRCRSIALFVTWKQLGFFILLYLAALQNVPKELYESASTDGAGAWQTFCPVTVPGVRPATVLVLLLAIITGANLFTEPYLLTGGGGPDGASTSPVLLMYQQGIEQGNPDVASAIGVVLVIVRADHRAGQPAGSPRGGTMTTSPTSRRRPSAPTDRRVGRKTRRAVRAGHRRDGRC